MALLETETWPQEIFQVLIENRVQQVAYIPDIGHASLIKLCHNSDKMKTVVLTTEEEGVALLAGAWLGGDRGVLLLQSSGVGNCINMLSLTRVCRMPLLILVTMRGEWGEFNPWQVPMGQHANQALTMAGVLTFTVNEKNRIKDTIEASARMAFEGPAATAVLISQRILGAKTFSR
ncbi:MAG: thiamine pyrophosphate-binding protein [Desulfobacterales bacterium]|jgi:sulfopyruvate decarboxylase alpha subunit